MKATFDSSKEHAYLNLEFKVSELSKANKVIKQLTSYGYSEIHRENSEYINDVPSKEYVIMCGEYDLTIAQMKEDYSEAKKVTQCKETN